MVVNHGIMTSRKLNNYILNKRTRPLSLSKLRRDCLNLTREGHAVECFGEGGRAS